MTSWFDRRLVVFLPALAGALLAGGPLLAQTPPTDQPQTAAQPGGPMTVETVHEGLVGGPDVRFSEVDGRQATLVGAHVGWLTDRRLLVGGAGYWLANRRDDLRLLYGGAVVEWFLLGQPRVDVSARSLVGLGSARLGETFDDWPWGRPPHPTLFGRGFAPPPPGPVRVLVDEGFFVVEPELRLTCRAASWVSLTGGVGYRAVAGAGDLDRRLRGVAASVSVVFGGS